MYYVNESAFRKQVMFDLKEMGLLSNAVSVSKHQIGDKGFPDVSFAGRGVIGAIECKMRGKQPTESQHEWRIAIQSAQTPFHDNILYYVAYPETWDEIRQDIQRSLK